MTPEQVIEILKTRIEAEEYNGNYTEKSLLIELYKMAEEYKELKKKEIDKNL